MNNDYVQDYLMHYGVKGMKWGVIHEKEKTPKKDTVFISGTSKSQDETSEYYRKELPTEVKKSINKIVFDKKNIVVGDAPGIDRQVQDYLNKISYDNVEIYGPGKKVRYCANKNWKTHPIDAPEFEEGSKEWLAKKDIAMEKVATEGLAIVLENGGASATRKNVQRLINNNKNVKVFELYSKGGDKWVKNLLNKK